MVMCMEFFQMNQMKPWVSPLHKARRLASAPAEPTVIVVLDEPEPIYCVSGLWQRLADGGLGQWQLLQELLPEYRLKLIEMPGHTSGDKRPVSLNDWKMRIRGQIRLDAPVSFFAHSAGVAACQLFENEWPEQVADMAMLSGSPLKTEGDAVPSVPKQFRFVKYLWKIWRNKQYRQTADDERFTRGGTAVNFGVESGLVTQQILFPRAVVQPLQCPSLVLAAMHDQFYPLHKGIQQAIADYNKSAYAVVRGTHMFHCDRDSATETVKYIRAWRSTLKSERRHVRAQIAA